MHFTFPSCLLPMLGMLLFVAGCERPRGPARIFATRLGARITLREEILMLDQTDVNSVKAQIDRYVQAALDGDWDAWGKTLTADVFYSPPNQAPINSREAALAWAKTFLKIKRFTVDIQEVISDGDLAYARGTYALELSLPDGSPAIERGAFLEVHRRQADGAWLYSHAMWHSTEPVPALAASA